MSRKNFGHSHPARVNQILAVLSDLELKRVLAAAELVSLKHGEILFQPTQVIDRIYFPLQGVVSLLTVLKNGTSVEAGMVGKEGVVGLCPLYGSESAFFRVIVQHPGETLRVRTEDLNKELNKRGTLFRCLSRFTAAFYMQVAQIAACNRLHSNKQRLCGWLLLMHDRIGSDTISMTHEFLSQMLGIGRVRVTEAARALQKEKLISYNWGKLNILNRPGLEAVACECYHSIREKYKLLLGFKKS